MEDRTTTNQHVWLSDSVYEVQLMKRFNESPTSTVQNESKDTLNTKSV